MKLNDFNFDKKRANDSQIRTFFSGYDDRWRLTKLISIKMTLEDREKLKRKLRSFYGHDFKEYEDNYIYNEVTNGLIFSAISELLMYVEDYIILMKSIREDEDFIKKVVFYYAKDIGKAAKRIDSLEDNELLKAYMVPSKSYLEEIMIYQSEGIRKKTLATFETGTQNLINSTRSVLEFFNDYKFFYNQYKHGLTVALRPFSGNLQKGELHRRKSSLDGLPISYDNETIDKAFKSGQKAFIIPNLTPEIHPGITKLQEERNLLRYRYGELIDINDLIDIGKQVHYLIRTLIKNRMDFIEPEVKEGNTFYLPIPKKKDLFRFAQIIAVPLEQPLILKGYNVSI